MRGAFHLLALAVPLAVLSACGGSEDGTQGKSRAVPSAKPTQAVAPYDQRFDRLSGTWTSAPGSAGGDGRFVQLDVASAGGFSLDVRQSKGAATFVVESARGKLDPSGTARSNPSELHGAFVGGLGSWTLVRSDGEPDGLTLRGANGTELHLSR